MWKLCPPPPNHQGYKSRDEATTENPETFSQQPVFPKAGFTSASTFWRDQSISPGVEGQLQTCVLEQIQQSVKTDQTWRAMLGQVTERDLLAPEAQNGVGFGVRNRGPAPEPPLSPLKVLALTIDRNG